MASDRLRRLLLLVFVTGVVGTSAELMLLEHFETWQQWLPLALLVLAPGASVALWLHPARPTVHALRVIAAAFVLSGLLGIYLHLAANLEFERELDATVGGTELIRETLTGALPALAPGAMILLGLVGFVITAGHPALETERTLE